MAKFRLEMDNSSEMNYPSKTEILSAIRRFQLISGDTNNNKEMYDF